MTVTEKLVVGVSYTLATREKGTEEESFIEKTDPSLPFVFLSGFGGVLPEFETNLQGLKVGDAFDFVIKAENGYGTWEEEMIVSVPMQVFVGEDGKVEEGLLKVGHVLPMMDNMGNQMQGLVIEVGEDSVKMDFNHPLSDKDLHFIGEIVSLREATQEELEHGHVHGPGGHHH